MSIPRLPANDPEGESIDNERPRCRDCGAQSPPTETNYTLISQRHGWRLVFFADESGRRIAEWRCPKCWVRRRDSKQKSEPKQKAR
jgi:hypothetical protein